MATKKKATENGTTPKPTTKKNATKKKTTGRPPGRSNDPPAIATRTNARCPKCASTERRALNIITERHLPGIAPDGEPRTHVIWRRVKCKQCDRNYVEQSHENRPA